MRINFYILKCYFRNTYVCETKKKVSFDAENSIFSYCIKNLLILESNEEIKFSFVMGFSE